MSTGYLPETITKDVLFERAKERFLSWSKMFTDPNVSATYMYEDMSASCYCGCPADDFPDDFKQEPKYHYEDDSSNCFFMLDGIKFNVYDLRSMRPCNRVDKETYTDVCVLNCDYLENDVMFYHIIPDTWLYGSSSNEFDEGKPVHQYFIDAAKKFIEDNYLIPEMQKMED